MSDNICPYDKIKFKSEFEKTEISKKLEQDFGKDNLIWDKFFYSGLPPNTNPIRKNTYITPREAFSNYFSMAIFYYLLPLLAKDYDLIYDLGCGKNLFKPYIPRLIGVGAEHMLTIGSYNRIKDPSWPDISTVEEFENLSSKIKQECINYHNFDTAEVCRMNGGFHGDVHGLVDDDYVSQHQNYFSSVFSICALHFAPLTMFKKTIVDFNSMIKPGGRGFLSLNLKRMIEFTTENFLINQFSTDCPTKSQYEEFLRAELSNSNLNFLILDIDLTVMDESMNGNIRLVIEK
jgi:hypothetical protein